MRTTQYFKTTNEEAPCDLRAAIISGRAPVDEDIVVEHIGNFARQWWSWLVCAGFKLLKESTILINSELVLQVEEHKTAYYALCSTSHQEKSSLTHDVHIDVPLIAALGVPHNHLEDEKEQKCKQRQLLKALSRGKVILRYLVNA